MVDASIENSEMSVCVCVYVYGYIVIKLCILLYVNYTSKFKKVSCPFTSAMGRWAEVKMLDCTIYWKGREAKGMCKYIVSGVDVAEF